MAKTRPGKDQLPVRVLDRNGNRTLNTSTEDRKGEGAVLFHEYVCSSFLTQGSAWSKTPQKSCSFSTDISAVRFLRRVLLGRKKKQDLCSITRLFLHSEQSNFMSDGQAECSGTCRKTFSKRHTPCQPHGCDVLPMTLLYFAPSSLVNAPGTFSRGGAVRKMLPGIIVRLWRKLPAGEIFAPK